MCVSKVFKISECVLILYTVCGSMQFSTSVCTLTLCLCAVGLCLAVPTVILTSCGRGLFASGIAAALPIVAVLLWLGAAGTNTHTVPVPVMSGYGRAGNHMADILTNTMSSCLQVRGKLADVNFLCALFGSLGNMYSPSTNPEALLSLSLSHTRWEADDISASFWQHHHTTAAQWQKGPHSLWQHDSLVHAHWSTSYLDEKRGPLNLKYSQTFKTCLPPFSPSSHFFHPGWWSFWCLREASASESGNQ